MTLRFAALITLGLLATAAAAEPPSVAAPVDMVDPFIGVDAFPQLSDGAVFPGATVPFGVIKPGPDMVGGDGNPGWKSGLPIEGFSQIHLSGTGGGAEYGNILVQPFTGEVVAHGLASAYSGEDAHPGRFHVTLDRFKTNVDIAATRRSALYRFEFTTKARSNLMIDVGHILSSGAEWTNPVSRRGENQELVASEVTIVSPTEVSGSQTVSGGWNRATRPYTVYFYAFTDTPAISSGTVNTNFVQPGGKHEDVKGSGGVGAWFNFGDGKPRTVKMRIGISFISIAQAKASLAAEIPDFDFDAVAARARATWAKALSPVRVDGATDDQRKLAYTALYHQMLMPTDRTGENPLWQSNEPSYDDYYAVWDIFRTTSPFLGLIAPDRQAGIVRSLIDIHAHEGWMPDARKGNFSGVVQGGSNSDMMLGDALAKHLPGIDWNAAYKAMLTNAETVPADPMRVGRWGLAEWKSLGYLTMEDSDMQGSRAVEYAANDWCVAQVAKYLGKMDDYRKYLARSGQWRNMFDPKFEHEGFKGFIRPRHRDGSWMTPFDPTEQRSQGYPGFYEGDSWVYSFYAPHDEAGVINAMGGRDIFIKRMARFFAAPDTAWGGPSRYYPGNEPSFLVPYLYIWAGRHDLTAERVRTTLAQYFNSSRAGMPGNDDSGAMSGWFLTGLIGIYPNAGSDVWLIGSPGVKRTTLTVGPGRSFIIDAPATSPTAKYVVGATLNGRQLNRAWLHHAELVKGGTLHLDMAETPAHWPEGPPPPSESGVAK